MDISKEAVQKDVSNTGETSTQRRDGSPLDIVDLDGAIALPTKTAFQTDLISIRVRARAAWAVTPGGAQVVNNVNW